MNCLSENESSPAKKNGVFIQPQMMVIQNVWDDNSTMDDDHATETKVDDQKQNKNVKKKQNRQKNKRKRNTSATDSKEVSNNKKKNSGHHWTSRFIYPAPVDSQLTILYCILKVVFESQEQIKVSPHRKILIVVQKPAKYDPQHIAMVLKHLQFDAIAIHAKSSKVQRQEHISRFQVSKNIILVTNQHFAQGLDFPELCDVVVLGSQLPKGKSFPQGNLIQLPATEKLIQDSVSKLPVFSKTTLDRAKSRVKLASQLQDICRQIQTQRPKDGWSGKLAKAAGLDDEAPDYLGNEAKANPILAQQQQKIQGLTERLSVVLAQPLVLSGSKSKKCSNEEMKQKMQLLGMPLSGIAAANEGKNERLSAQTKWIDSADGQAYGGAWEGPIRHGATKCKTSLKIRREFERSKLKLWKPNENPCDVEKWGGRYGKPCGHNEIVMHDLRPFSLLEVLHSRICSRQFPAPGNRGFDGCFEYLKIQCKQSQRAMTVWDMDAYHFFDTDGCVSSLPKTFLLHYSAAELGNLLANLRDWTIFTHGQKHPLELIRSLRLLGFWSRTCQLPSRVKECILAYTLKDSRVL